ncbi:hypothetical protein BJ165DRAFT_1405082 [Panaeolus papilionaceus]|nr:hypothetical protein BJ165DRAFT_1405082 [Panaeolus papilionaceus]
MPTLTKQIGTPKKGTSNLPIEIYQLIIDTIHEGTNCSASEKLRDLRACSLVCRSFVALCQRHLFAEAQVGPGFNGGLDRDRLALSLQSNASLANFVKRMVYSSPSNAVQPGNAPFLSLLLHLPQVQYLHIYCEDESPDFGRVLGQPYGASHFFKQYISSGSLTSLSIDGVKLVPLIASEPGLPPASSSLRLLDLQHVDGVSLSCFPTGMHLNTLCIAQSFEGFLGTLSFSTVFPILKNLRIHAVVITDSSPSEDTIVRNRILESVTQLECLVIEAVLIGTYPKIPLQIRECVSNTRASLKCLHLYYTVETMDIITDGIYDVLSSIQNDNILEDIEIVVFFSWSIGFSTTLRGIMMPTLKLWSKLNELLDKDIVRFPCLRKVHIKILVMEVKHDHTVYDINCEELKEFRKGVGHSFRRLITDPEIEFRGRVGIHNHLSPNSLTTVTGSTYIHRKFYLHNTLSLPAAIHITLIHPFLPKPNVMLLALVGARELVDVQDVGDNDFNHIRLRIQDHTSTQSALILNQAYLYPLCRPAPNQESQIQSLTAVVVAAAATEPMLRPWAPSRSRSTHAHTHTFVASTYALFALLLLYPLPSSSSAPPQRLALFRRYPHHPWVRGQRLRIEIL